MPSARKFCSKHCSPNCCLARDKHVVWLLLTLPLYNLTLPLYNSRTVRLVSPAFIRSTIVYRSTTLSRLSMYALAPTRITTCLNLHLANLATQLGRSSSCMTLTQWCATLPYCHASIPHQVKIASFSSCRIKDEIRRGLRILIKIRTFRIRCTDSRHADMDMTLGRRYESF